MGVGGVAHNSEFDCKLNFENFRNQSFRRSRVITTIAEIRKLMLAVFILGIFVGFVI